MTKEKWISAAALAMLLTTATSCSDWGRKDPPAGDQVKPTLENVAVYDFEAEEGLDPALFKAVANPGGVAPEIVDDEIKGKVLSLNNGYLTLTNPLNKVTLQEAASFTFWMRQPVLTITDEEGNETNIAQDLTGPMITFENTTGNGRLAINPNGGIVYSAPDGEWIENDPAAVTTGYLTPGVWHYVAIILNDEGYEWWVDGERKVAKTVTNFNCEKLVKFTNNVPVMTIGSPDNHSLMLIDDLKVYRNAITSKEIARPNLGGGGSGGNEGPDLSKWVLLGNEDNSTGFWSTWSDYADLTGDGTIHYEFYNYHGDNNSNWQNWALVLTNGIPRGADGYAEYLYLRADAWGWGSAWDAEKMSSDFNWDTFMAEMEGAFVTVDITRKGNSFTVTANVTAEDGTKRTESISSDVLDSPILGSFLTCEGSHLLINPEEVFVGQVYAPGQMITGQTDCSTPWWSAHSPNNKFDGNFDKWGVEFINHTTGAGANWNNWLLVCSNGPWVGEGGYAEYFVLRSDAYGWGASFDQGNTSMEQAFDWDTYVADMKDARVGADYARGNGGTATGYYSKKYLNNIRWDGTVSAQRHACPIFRYAEILLAAAEALNEAGKTGEAYEYVNQVRGRVGMPAYSGMSQAELRERIQNEARIEFCFEDHRYFDVRRWKLHEKNGGSAAAESSLPRYRQVFTLYGVAVKDGTSKTFNYGLSDVDSHISFMAPKNYFFPIPYAEQQKTHYPQTPGWEL